jgi:flagellar hook-length control protein FliK
MVVKSAETKKASSLIDLLGGTAKNKTSKTTDVFSQLLASLNSSAKVEKSFGVVVDPKTQSKTPKINDIVKLNTKIVEEPFIAEETKMLPKEVITVLSNDQVRTLIQKAKEFLKNEITAKAPENQIDIKTLPKTLMGLVEVANKIGIDMSSISLSTLDDSVKTLSKDLPTAVLTQSLFTLQKAPLTQDSTAPKTLDIITQLLTQTKGVAVEEKPDIENQKTTSQPLQSLLNQETTEEKPVKENQKTTSQPLQSLLNQATTTAEEKPVKENQKLTSQPLQSLLNQATTEEKPVIENQKTTSQPLQSLLTTAEEKPVKENQKSTSQPLQSLLKDLSASGAATIPTTVAATIEPIALITPKTTVSSIDSIGSLLRGENKTDKPEKGKEEISSLDDPSKLLNVRKEGSIEVKSKEATQSLSHFATDLKEAADNYKPPFTRITMKLNPEKLGEVDVTLVQRGNNIHVNIQSSNASSVTFLASNAMELRTQLASQGISNATMNFMSGGDNPSQNPQQQQQQQQQNRFQAYTSLSDLESNGEQLSALEIILPHYA